MPASATAVPHRIVSTLRGDTETCRFGTLSATHHTDALSRLCRKMVAEGITGRAVVVDGDGRPSLHVRSVEALAKRTLRETDRGFLRVVYRPRPVECTGAPENGFSPPSAPLAHPGRMKPLAGATAHRKRACLMEGYV